MKLKKLNKNLIAVSEVVGTLLLLVISVTIFSVIYLSVFSVDVSPSTPSVNLLGTIKENSLTFDHRGGEDLGTETKIQIMLLDGSVQSYLADPDNYLNDENLNNKWNIGERFNLNLSYLPNYTRFDPLDIMIIDHKTNSAVMRGTVQESRTADIKVTITPSEQTATIGDTVHFTVSVQNLGPSQNKNITVRNILPAGLVFADDPGNPDQGTYNINTGIWDVGALDSEDGPVNFSYYATVTNLPYEVDETTLVFILDGSSSIPLNDFDMAKEGIMGAITDEGIVPRDGSIELYVFYLYSTPTGSDFLPRVTTYGPYKVLSSTINHIETEIRGIDKEDGKTPLALAMKKATDDIVTDGYDSDGNRIIINLITDGGANIAQSSSTKGTYDGTLFDTITQEGWGSFVEQGIMLVEEIGLNPSKDEIDALVINGLVDGDNVHYEHLLRTAIVWPQVGELWASSGESPLPGWTRMITTEDDVIEAIDYQLNGRDNRRINTAEFISSDYTDPNPENNVGQAIVNVVET